ncbi:MAG: hypothetical protein N4A49_02355 [Marinifilaceae bacterium]|jgi:hypothetical protein|nr:hypothetical protein [Marinifilaceae bacterium]
MFCCNDNNRIQGLNNDYENNKNQDKINLYKDFDTEWENANLCRVFIEKLCSEAGVNNQRREIIVNYLKDIFSLQYHNEYISDKSLEELVNSLAKMKQLDNLKPLIDYIKSGKYTVLEKLKDKDLNVNLDENLYDEYKNIDLSNFLCDNIEHKNIWMMFVNYCDFIRGADAYEKDKGKFKHLNEPNYIASCLLCFLFFIYQYSDIKRPKDISKFSLDFKVYKFLRFLIRYFIRIEERKQHPTIVRDPFLDYVFYGWCGDYKENDFSVKIVNLKYEDITKNTSQAFNLKSYSKNNCDRDAISMKDDIRNEFKKNKKLYKDNPDIKTYEDVITKIPIGLMYQKRIYTLALQKEDIEWIFSVIMQRFEDLISNPNITEKELKEEIDKLILYLERFHPFYDGNTRLHDLLEKFLYLFAFRKMILHEHSGKRYVNNYNKTTTDDYTNNIKIGLAVFKKYLLKTNKYSSEEK